MKVTISELTPKKGVIKIEGTQPYFVNSLRRIMISELPKLAINEVVIYDNTSALFDEIIAHRLGMIPIPTDLDLITFRDQCVCKGKGCPSCTIRYTLSKEGEGAIYSGDLQPSEKSWTIIEDKIPIVELFGDQRLILEVEAVLGCGKDHAKWQPVHAAGYQVVPEIEIDATRMNEIIEFIKDLPPDLVTLKNNKLEINDISMLPVLESYIEKSKVSFITIKRNHSKIIFHFETDSALTAEEAVKYSAKILNDKYSEFNKLLKQIK